MRGLLGATLTVLCWQVAAPAGAAPGPPSAPEYWFDAWHVPALWAGGVRGQGITVAEIDTGVNAALPQLRGRVLPGADLGRGGPGTVDRSAGAFGHGTAMASLMVARPGPFGIVGLAPEAKVLPIAVPLAGTTDARADDLLPRAIRAAADRGANIISLSVTGGAATTATCPPAEQQAIDYALRRGVAVFAAGGNRGGRESAAEDPGDCRGVVSVGAVDRAGTVAAFSSRHGYLTLTAPGVAIPTLSTESGTAYTGDGTSQATALTAASAALVWSAHRSLTARQVVARILATLDRHRRVPDPAHGYGNLDTYRAVTAPVASDAPNPVYAAAAPLLSGARPPQRRPLGTVLAAVGAAAGFAVVLAWAVLRRRRTGRVSPAPGREPLGSAH